MRRLLLSVVAAFLACTMLAGCGPSGPQRVMAKVKGKVMHDGKPLTQGRVVFQSKNGAPGFSDLTEAGSYELETGVGPNQVTIHSREPGSTDPTKGLPMQGKSRIPEKYETPFKSGLSLDVQPNKENTADFTLTK